MGLSVRSSLYPFLSDVRILHFLSSSLSLPITPLLSVTNDRGKEGGKWFRKYTNKWESWPGWKWGGMLNFRSDPHPFDRLLSGTARPTRRKRTGKPEKTLHTLPWQQRLKKLSFFVQTGNRKSAALSPAKSTDFKTSPTSTDVSDDSLSCQISRRSPYLLRFVFLLLLQAKQPALGLRCFNTPAYYGCP